MTLRNTQNIGAEDAEDRFFQVTWKRRGVPPPHFFFVLMHV